jgi:hypothetical protein
MPGHTVRCDYLAHYDMDHSTHEQRTAFLETVKRIFHENYRSWERLRQLSAHGGSWRSPIFPARLLL